MRRTFWIAIVILGGAVAGSVLLAGRLAAKQQAANPALPAATAEIIRTTLVETRTVAGTLSYGELTPVNAIGNGMLTWIAPVGSTVTRGEPLFKVDERPVIVVYGLVPMYRRLEIESEAVVPEEGIAKGTIDAVDVEAGTLDILLPTGEVLTLVGGEHAIIIVDGEPATLNNLVVGAKVTVTFDVETKEATEIEAGAVVPEEGETAGNLVSGADVRQLQENLAELGYTGFAVDGIYTSATAAAVRTWQADLGLPETGTLEPGQLVFTPGAIRIAAHTARVGDVLVERGVPVLNYTGTTRLVTVQLRLADQALAVGGRKVSVAVPGRGAVEGEISKVDTVVTVQEGTTDALIEVTVTIADQEALGALDAAPVDVDFVSEERTDVLAVPVAALLALPEGGYGVEVVEGGTTRIVPVRTGMFAGGRVEISGEGIAEGVAVVVPR